MFSVTDDRLPSTWRAAISRDGELDLAPSAWLSEQFWGEYYSETREIALKAHDVFEREVAALEAENHH
jgi:hypothetical protein